jgi:hypothetical protein
MAKKKGPTWTDVHKPGANNIVVRECGGFLRKFTEHGRSRVWLRCPFCKATVQAYLWSLAGGGKRCDCGALAGSGGTFHQFAENVI